MPLIFPTNPTVDQTYQSGNSATYKWNGSYWIVSAPVQTGLTVSTASYAERTAWVQSTPPGTGTGSLWYSTETGNTYIRTGTAWAPATNGTVNSVSSSVATSSSYALNSTNAVTASYLNGSSPTYIQASKGITQALAVGNNTLTNWVTELSSNAGEWNPTTGVFTATKAGVYSVYGTLFVSSVTWNQGAEVSIWIAKNGGITKPGRWYAEYPYTSYAPTIQISSLVSLAVGETISIIVYHNNSVNPSTFSNGTYLTIQELPSRVQR